MTLTRRSLAGPARCRAFGIGLALCGLLFAVAPGAFGLDKSIVLGSVDNWKSVARLEGATIEPNAAGNEVLALAADQYIPDAATDLLLHFNTAPPRDASGNYATASSTITVSRRWARIGSGAGVFQGQNPAIVLTPASPAALFAPGTEWKDFTIEFWMYTAALSEGETVLFWRGAIMQGGTVLSQDLRCDIEDGKLTWSFRNFFLPPGGGPFSLTLRESRDIIPREWHHYTLRFDGDTGMLELMVDGVPDSYAYANALGRENGAAYLPQTGGAGLSTLTVGDGFVGFLDELRISRTFIHTPSTSLYSPNPGTVVTSPIDLGYSDSPITSITTSQSTPGNTGVFYYYRVSNVKTDPEGLPGNWIQFAPGAPLAGAPKGRYVQFKIELLPGGTGGQTPTVSSLTLTYTPRLPPPAPAFLIATPGDGSVSLSWRAVISPDLAGYRIYYGTRPQQYFGTGSTAGDSPVDVGKLSKFTLDGLANGQLYYFAVVAYDGSTPPHLSAFSNEVAARPSAIAGAGP